MGCDNKLFNFNKLNEIPHQIIQSKRIINPGYYRDHKIFS